MFVTGLSIVLGIALCLGTVAASYVKLLAAGDEASSGAGTGAENSSGIDHLRPGSY